MRARACQEWLTAIQNEDEPWKSRFFARLDPRLRETIESASRVAWLPIGAHVKLADVLQEAYGVVRAHDYYRRAFGAALSGPVLGPFVRTAAKVLGITVHAFARWAGKGWDTAFKNAGGLAGEVIGPEKARITYYDLPPVCTASEAWMRSAQGSAYGVYDIVGVDGVVRLDLSRRSEGKMILDLEWTSRGGEVKRDLPTR